MSQYFGQGELSADRLVTAVLIRPSRSLPQPAHLRIDLGADDRQIRADRGRDVRRRQVRIVPVNHAGIGMTERMGNDGQWGSVLHEQACIGVS